jgi:2,3-bisphosphoglycerate-independent phosphoglycerate mutase
MKGIFIILDGVADLPVQSLGQKTPLEAAKTPNLDTLAKKSKLDYCHTVGEGIAPQSSNAVISLLGQDPSLAPRGSLEAQGAGIELKNGDLSFRTNFATIDNLKDLNILDRRAGRNLTTKEAKILAKAVNEQVKLHYPFEFRSTVNHRGVLVIRGGFSESITNQDPAYGIGVVHTNTKNKIVLSKPTDDEEDSKLSADLINSFMEQSFKVLDKHPINLARARKGLFSANVILSRDAGNHPVKFRKLKGKWAAINYMPLEIGIGKACKMDILKFKRPKMRGIDIYANLYMALKGFIKFTKKTLKRNHKKYDYFYIHFKKTDTPGHDNLPKEKVKIIEMLDQKFFSFLKDFIKNNKLLITADHTTACKYKAHTSDPVPVLTYPHEDKKNSEQRFTEFWGSRGKKILGRKLLESNFFS